MLLLEVFKSDTLRPHQYELDAVIEGLFKGIRVGLDKLLRRLSRFALLHSAIKSVLFDPVVAVRATTSLTHLGLPNSE